jgi:hypothetical protein
MLKYLEFGAGNDSVAALGRFQAEGEEGYQTAARAAPTVGWFAKQGSSHNSFFVHPNETGAKGQESYKSRRQEH